MAEAERNPGSANKNPIRDFTTAGLNFLSRASNGTLGACAIGLCASTYLILGRLGLVLIGAVGGIVLHATWEDYNGGGGSQEEQASRRKRELGIEIVQRTLDWRSARRETSSTLEKIEASASTERLGYDGFQKDTRAALEKFSDAVILNYVDWWYGPILPSEQTFPDACRQTLNAFLLSISGHLSRKRKADPFLDFLANSTSILIVFLNELATALRASQRAEPEEAIRTYLSYQPESNLANVLSTTQQQKKLNLVADDILQTFLESKAYNFLPSKMFLQEVLSKLVLEETVKMCSKPEWINGWIVYLLEEGEPEIMVAIDAGVEPIAGAPPNEKRPEAFTARNHKRRISKAEEAMEEALLEAKRMNEMIAEEEARRQRDAASNDVLGESMSSAAPTENGIATPATSDESEDSVVLDSDGVPHVIPSPMRKDTTQIDKQATQSPLATPDYENAYNFSTELDQAQSSSTIQPLPSPAPEDMNLLFTLHNASITMFDEGGPNEKLSYKQKPQGEYMLQIEPASSRFPGWITTRKYADFESLHESLKRIAVISGASKFADQYILLPTWKARARGALTQDLEIYLRAALKFESLAESEAMKKFLDKEIGLEKVPMKNKNVLQHGQVALGNVGKGFVNVLGQSGKGVVGGGKVVLGGVQGVFGAVATGVGVQKRTPAAASRADTTRSASPRKPSSPRPSPRPSYETSTSSISQEDLTAPPLPARPTERANAPESPKVMTSVREEPEEFMNLPPPPSQITSDYVPIGTPSATPSGFHSRETESSRPTTPTPSTHSSLLPTPITTQPQPEPPPISRPEIPHNDLTKSRKQTPITEEETRITIELLFAIITELYSLSTAWTGTIRLSLLSAAKTYLLRPANPQLESIRTLLQETVIETNTSDAGIAFHLNTLRANTMPTKEERAMWPAELSEEEKEKLRIKARKLLVERGLPAVLIGVMGQVATGEALGRVFDCLQVEEVARGLIFALMLQALRAATQ